MMSAACARLLGAEHIFMVDPNPYRLRFAAETWSVEPIDLNECDDPAELIIGRTGFRGVDATIDAIGFEAKGSAVDTMATTLKMESSSGFVLRQAIAATRRGGIVSLAGVYAGFVQMLLIGDAFDKGIGLRMGQTHVQHFMPMLLERLLDGSLRPEIIISHRMALADAARGYEISEEKREDCRKVVLVPGSA